MSDLNFDTTAKMQAQKEYCLKKHLPWFAGDGTCPHCHRNIYEGNSYVKCSTDLLTGCPFCRTSLVD